jgi:hypothetical protein
MQICTGNPNQVWAYDEPLWIDGVDYGNHHVEQTENEILCLYYPFWSEKMFELGKLPMVTEHNCIDDWIILNLSYKVNMED